MKVYNEVCGSTRYNGKQIKDLLGSRVIEGNDIFYENSIIKVVKKGEQLYPLVWEIRKPTKEILRYCGVRE